MLKDLSLRTLKAIFCPSGEIAALDIDGVTKKSDTANGCDAEMPGDTSSRIARKIPALS
jgi:hypothetical protein